MELNYTLLICLLVAVAAIAYMIKTPKASSILDPHVELLNLKKNWQAPAELLNPPSLRSLRLKGIGYLSIGLVVLMALIVAAVNYATYQDMAEQTKRYEQIIKDGEKTNAEVLQKKSERHRKYTDYFIYYKFEIGGKIYYTTQLVDSQAYWLIAENSLQPIIYLPTNPNINRLSVQKPPKNPLYSLLMTGLILFIFTAVGAPAYRTMTTLKKGVPTAGVVLSTSRRRRRYTVNYQFQNSQGQFMKGKADVGSLDSVIEGSLITVVYLENDPSQSTIYPSSLFSVA